jgi:ATP-binding protein involved in chromosome partitioning
MQRGLPTKKPIQGVASILLVASGKGGVGKSTVAVNLATAFSRLGRRTGLLDADLFGPSVPRMMNLHAQVETRDGHLVPLTNYGVKCMSMGFLIGDTAPVVWRGLMVMKALEQLIRQVHWAPLDILVVDMPPGTGDTQLSISQMLPVSGAVIVSTPQDVAVADARKGVEMFRKVDIPIMGIVKNKSRFECPKCQECTTIYSPGPANNFDRLLTELQISLLADIPIDPAISVDGDTGTPIVVRDPLSVAAQEYIRTAQNIIGRL